MNSKKIIIGLFLATVLFVTSQVVFAGGAREPVLPDVTISGDDTFYISPTASLGERDELQLEYSVNPGKRRRITQINHVVNDLEGSTIWDEELILQKPSRDTIESVFTWDGRNNSRRFVEDGTYLVEIQAQDNRGNEASSRIIQVYVDNTPPENVVRFPYRVFSPNDDGEKDFFIIEQDGSREAEWFGSIKDRSGKVVYDKEWRQSVPGNFTWDGTDIEGTILPDGEYSYSIYSRDEAGNVFQEDYPNIIIDTTDTAIQLQRNVGSFSPNNDGKKDSVQIQPTIRNRESILKWSFSIVDEHGNPVLKREENGTVPIPEVFDFDGMSSSGEMLQEGVYTAVMEIIYTNGSNPSAETEPFDLDVTPPSAAVEIETEIFSPNGDGRQDTLVIRQSASAEQSWRGQIVDSVGQTVRSFSWLEQPDEAVIWNGRDDDGQVVSDGLYTYRLTATDNAENSTEVSTVPFEKATFDIEDISLSVSALVFSPNSDGVRDSVTFDVEIAEAGELEEFEFAILDESSSPVYTERGEKKVKKTIEWDGTDNNGDPVAEGNYTARLTAFYISGDEPSRSVGPIQVDVSEPTITVETDHTVFSPNGDGNRDRINIRQESSEEKMWRGNIGSASGETVFEYAWRGKVTDVFWDGTDTEGNVVPDGVYTYSVSSTDEAGNTGSATRPGLTVDTVPTPIQITRETGSFSPNDDGEQDTIALNLYAAVERNILSWEVKIVNARGRVVRNLSLPADEELPKSVEWDGLNERGSVSAEGEYSAVFSVLYRNGNAPVEKLETPFYLDLTPPEVSVSIAPRPFSPDNDGVDDTVKISINVTEETEIAGWTGIIFDPRGMEFIAYSGEGNPTGTIEWDGTAEDGERVQAASYYTLELNVRDTAGNTKTVKQVIPVDVFITRENGQEKIMISSILFPPRSDDFTAVAKQQAKTNEEIIDRIAEVLQRFEGYKITIIGYAVSMLWDDPEAAAEEQRTVLIPLSKNRAESVKEALVERGIEAGRLSTEGQGGLDPVVPHGAYKEHWKNRRVEFILERQ